MYECVCERVYERMYEGMYEKVYEHGRTRTFCKGVSSRNIPTTSSSSPSSESLSRLIGLPSNNDLAPGGKFTLALLDRVLPILFGRSSVPVELLCVVPDFPVLGRELVSG